MLPYTTYFIDLDGVIYRGNELLPGAKEFVAWLESHKKRYLFLTNNSFATGAQILAKLTRLGIAADADHLLTAGQAAVQNIVRRFPKGVVYVVGEQPLIDLVAAQGLTPAHIDSQEADAVLVGLDRDFDYAKLTCAAGSGISPEVVGKPEPMLLQEAMEQLGSKPDETVMIGDGLHVDILAGKNAGTHTLLVLSGSSTREDVEASSIKPDHIYENLAAVMKEVTSEANVKT